MKQCEQIEVRVAGHEFRIEVAPEERTHVERAAEQASERISKLSSRSAAMPPAKVAAMVAFQFACDLSIANELLDDAEKLHSEVRRQKEAVQRLEGLLAKVDTALAY